MNINLNTTFRSAFATFLRTPAAPGSMIKELHYDFLRLGSLCDKTLGEVGSDEFKAFVKATWEKGPEKGPELTRRGTPFAFGTCRSMRDRLPVFLGWLNRQLGEPGRYVLPPLGTTTLTPTYKPGEHYLDPDFLRSLIFLIALSRRSPGWELMSSAFQLMLAYGCSPEEIAAIKVSDCDFTLMAITWPDGTVRGDFPSFQALEEIRAGINGRLFAFHEKGTEAKGTQRIRDLLKMLYRRKRPDGPGATELKEKFKYFPRRMAKTVAMAKEDPEGLLKTLEGIPTTGGKIQIPPKELERLKELKRQMELKEQADDVRKAKPK